MRKRKSTRETKNMIQTALWLPREMHERLRKDGGERGLGDEIRRRLVASFVTDEGLDDGLTNLLAQLTKKIALKISLDADLWWTNSLAFEVFKAAIDNVLSDLISAAHPKEEPPPEALARFQTKYGPDAKPGTIGAKIANAALVENATELLRKRSSGNQEE